MSESEVVRKLAHRGRGLTELEKRVGPVCRQIETRLIGTSRKMRVLEIGCGFGVALMQLRRRFRDRVELTGVNKESSHGDADAMLEAAALRDAGPASDVGSVALPRIIHRDVAHGLPFDDRSFDLVISQMCIQYVQDKVLLLRETARVVKEDGIALIHTPLSPAEIPAPYTPLLEIWEQGAPLTLRDYLAGRRGHASLQFGYHSCAHLSHCEDFGTGLELVRSIQLNQLCPAWDGVKSVYRREH